jgi:SAM-dependent methyltransferase
MSNKEIFDNIYQKQFWGKDSGCGSDPKNAKEWISLINNFIKEKEIKSVLDLGCGDWRIGKELNLDNVNYTGVDVSSVIINKIKHNEKDNIKFVNHDIESFDIPKVDLVLLKDVLQHLALDSTKKILDKVSNNAKYVLISNDFNKNNIYGNKTNYEIKSGHHVYLDLTISPFSYDLKHVLDFNSCGQIKRVYLYESNI